MADVHVDNLVKRYGAVTALKQVSVSIADGSLTAILGPSGCGKTTLLRCIAGLLLPDEGRIVIGSQDVTRAEPFRRNLGMVFQRPSMFPHMTVYENIAWGLRLRRWPKHDVPRRVREILQLVRLHEMEDRRFNQLSGGQAQRVVIARALAPKPDLLLLDEPLSALDAKLRAELLEEIVDIQRETRCTTILVTHDQSEALTAADSLILMNEGEVVQQGPPLEIYRRPQSLFSASFIGTNNMLPCVVARLDKHQVTLKVENAPLEITAEMPAVPVAVGEPVWACIRADDIDVIPPDAAPHHRNVATITVGRAALTGGFVSVEAHLGSYPLHIHVSGSRRFALVEQKTAQLTVSLAHVTLVPRCNRGGSPDSRNETDPFCTGG